MEEKHKKYTHLSVFFYFIIQKPMNEHKLLKIILWSIFWVFVILWLYFLSQIFDTPNSDYQTHPLINQEMDLYDLSWSYSPEYWELDYNQWDYQGDNMYYNSSIDFWLEKVDIQEENIAEWEALLPE